MLLCPKVCLSDQSDDTNRINQSHINRNPGLKILVSVVRFRLSAPSHSTTCDHAPFPAQPRHKNRKRPCGRSLAASGVGLTPPTSSLRGVLLLAELRTKLPRKFTSRGVLPSTGHRNKVTEEAARADVDRKPNFNRIAWMAHSVCKSGIKNSLSSLASRAMPRR